MSRTRRGAPPSPASRVIDRPTATLSSAQATASFLKGKGCAHYLRSLRSRSGSTDNHATSGLKFRILVRVRGGGSQPPAVASVGGFLLWHPHPALGPTRPAPQI